jgi:hypothetical protein
VSWDNNSTAAMGASSGPIPDQYNTWYAYPDYFMNQVVTQANCNPAFPAWAPANTIQTTGTNPATGATDQPIIQTTATVVTSAAYCVPAAPVNVPSALNGTCTPSDPSTCAGPFTTTTCTAGTPMTCTMVTSWFPTNNSGAPPVGTTDQLGEEAAYGYLSSKVLGGQNVNCAIESMNTNYTGIRCEYTNLNATANLNMCMLNAPPYVSSFGSTTISPNDWYAVLAQVQTECKSALQVQALYSNFDKMVNSVFISNQ